MINIGKYIEMAINWLTENFTLFFDAINVGIGGFIDGFQNVLMWIPFYITIVLLTLLAWYKSGKGVGVFTVFGLLLIWSMGFWNETMQTLALVLSSTIIALIIGLPLGIWSANSQRCDKILHPILDLMQTMPAFVYLIPAVLFFGLGTVPGAFATIIFATPPVVRLTSLGIKHVFFPDIIIAFSASVIFLINFSYFRLILKPTFYCVLCYFVTLRSTCDQFSCIFHITSVFFTELIITQKADR